MRGKTLAQILNEVPEIDGEYKKQKARHITKTNKDRSRRMEQRIAKLLGGNRVPMSGAGSIKGDCIVSTPIGMVSVECKYSAGTRNNEPHMIVNKHWFIKLEEDVKALRAAFGILVFHYHNVSHDYVFVPERVAHRFLDTTDIATVEDTDRVAFQFTHVHMRERLLTEGAIRYIIRDKPYILTTLQTFIEGLEELRGQDTA